MRLVSHIKNYRDLVKYHPKENNVKFLKDCYRCFRLLPSFRACSILYVLSTVLVYYNLLKLFSFEPSVFFRCIVLRSDKYKCVDLSNVVPKRTEFS